MTAKGYSAGAIFLQVVPVFANVQKAIEDEAKNIDRALGDQMEKSGEKAGERAGKAASKAMEDEVAKSSRKISDEMGREFQRGVDEMEKALGGISTKNLGKRLRAEVKEMRAELESLSDVDLKVDDNFEKVSAKVAALRKQIEDMRARSKVFFDIKGLPEVYRKIHGLEKTIKAVDGTIDVNVDTKPAERQMGAFEKSFKATADRAAKALSGSVSKEARKLRDELKYLENLRIGIDVSANQARRELGEIEDDLKRLQAESDDIDVKVDTAAALGELSAFQAALNQIDGETVTVDVDTSGLKRASRDANDAANTFRSFNIYILAATSVGPGLIPVLAGIAGGLLAIGPAAAVATFGLGSVLVGFSGLSDALSALQAQEDQAATTAQTAAKQRVSASNAIADATEALSDAQRRAARAEEDAAEAVADARERAADAIENALERQKDAQEAYRDSVEEVREAEQALRDARREAADDGEDIARQIEENQLAIEQGLLDAFHAQVEYEALQADGSATNAEQEQARINVERARLDLANLRDEQVELTDAKKKWDKEGVNGTEKVQTAQERLNESVEAQKEAYEGLREAAADVDEAREDGAKMVARAIEDQNEILADNARALEDARRNLARARQGQDDLNDSINAQQQAVDNAMDALGPAGRRFVLYLRSLRDEWHAFRDDIQTAMLPDVQIAMEGFFGSRNASVARDAMIGLADAFGRFARLLSTSLQGAAWGSFFEMLAELGPDIADAYGGAFVKFLEAMASIMTTLAPYALQFAEGFERLMTAFANWAESKAGQDAITGFMDYVSKNSGMVLEFLSAFVKAAVAIVVALAPWGEVVLVVLTAFLELIAGMDSKVLGAILTTLIVIGMASQVAYSIMMMAMAYSALAALSIGPVIAALIGVGAILAGLYVKNEEFRNFVQKAWGVISDAFSKSWKKHIKPALESLMGAMGRLWKKVLEPFFAWLGPIVLWALEKLIPLLGWVFAGTLNDMAWVVDKVLIPALTWMADAFKWLWRKVLKPALEDMDEAWENTLDGMAWVWKKVLKPVWDYITDTALPRLKRGFERTIDDIGKAWDTLKKIVGTPVKFVLDTIINDGLIGGFNKIAKWVKMDGIDPLPIPNALQSYATGGVLPGYTPGRDVHKFVSPTAGRLELSGGEAIMRPEFTAAVGTGFVDQMNSIARTKGARGVQQALGGGAGYWMGGVLPLDFASSIAQHSGYDWTTWAGDLNSPYDLASPPAAVRAWKAGQVAHVFHGYADQHGRYGNHVMLDHGGQSTLYAHLSSIVEGILGKTVSAGTMLGRVGDTGNSFGAHLHFEVLGGGVDYGDSNVSGKPQRDVPGWLMSMVKDPLGAVKNWMTAGLSEAPNVIRSPFFDSAAKVPLLAGQAVTDKVWDIIPGFVKSAAGWAGDAAGWVVGGVKDAAGAVGDFAGDIGSGVSGGIGAAADFLGFADGGVLPYNGTMKYDAGGYLPPGLTSVVNLTGKPEPVFTADQWENMGLGGGEPGLHYEPHFEGSDLTAEDVAADLNFTFRRIRRGGKYAGVGDQ